MGKTDDRKGIIYQARYEEEDFILLQDNNVDVSDSKKSSGEKNFPDNKTSDIQFSPHLDSRQPKVLRKTVHKPKEETNIEIQQVLCSVESWDKARNLSFNRDAQETSTSKLDEKYSHQYRLSDEKTDNDLLKRSIGNDRNYKSVPKDIEETVEARENRNNRQEGSEDSNETRNQKLKGIDEFGVKERKEDRNIEEVNQLKRKKYKTKKSVNKIKVVEKAYYKTPISDEARTKPRNVNYDILARFLIGLIIGIIFVAVVLLGR